MEALCSSETSVDSQRTTRRYIPEGDTLHNLKSYILRLGVVRICGLSTSGNCAKKWITVLYNYKFIILASPSEIEKFEGKVS
jgi:hypothetical protein